MTATRFLILLIVVVCCGLAHGSTDVPTNTPPTRTFDFIYPYVEVGGKRADVPIETSYSYEEIARKQ